MKTQKTLSRILDGLLLLVFILFFSSAGFQDRNTSGWYQQWFPNLNGSTIKDITFLDSLTGFAVTTTNSSVQAYILKTTNGGDNWNIIHTYVPPSVNSGFTRIQFATDSLGYASTNYFDIFKTMNSGLNWTAINTPWGGDDIAVINSDTILLANYDQIMGGIYRSINGGMNWTRIWTNGTSGNPSKIYMYDKNLGFACTDNAISSIFYRTTNGGANWTNLGDSTYRGIQFVDSLIGWKQTRNSMKKTTNGGLTWFYQTTPYFFYTGLYDLSIVNKDTLWYVGSSTFINNNFYGVICKTTNGGINWGYQIPDTAFRISEFISIIFINKNNGWAYQISEGVHTKEGGNDTTVYTGINNNNSTLLSEYKLFQNYPNPFNARTVVSCQLSVVSHVSIKVYDVKGHVVQNLVQGKQNPGMYKYIFNGDNLSSGIYFYSMIVDGKVFDTKKMLMIK